jgi:CRP-like cAMP-binding protein
LAFEKDKFLLHQDEYGKFFYIVKSGTLELLQDNVHVKYFYEMDCFGEIALLQNNIRTGSVRSVSNAELYVLDGEVFRTIMNNINEEKLKEKLFFIELIPILKKLNNIQKTNIAKLINLKEFRDQEKIFNDGDIGDSIYIIYEGILKCYSEKKEIRKLYPKEFFGQNSILMDSNKTLEIISIGKSSCFIFSKDILIEALGISYKDEILFSIFKYSFLNNSIFSEIFSDSQMEEIFKIFHLKEYKYNEVIYSAGVKHRKIVVLIEGNLVDVFIK